MYICLCNGITEKQIRRAIAAGANTLQSLHDELGVASQCGSCMDHALQMLDGTDGMDARLDRDLYYSAA